MEEKDLLRVYTFDDTVGCTVNANGKEEFFALVSALEDMLHRTPALKNALDVAMAARLLKLGGTDDNDVVTSPDLQKILNNNKENG